MREFGNLVEMRDHQRALVNSVFDDFNAGHKRVICVAGTGAGKTFCYGALASHYTAKKPDEIVLIISHLGLLISQTSGSLKKFFDINAGVLKADRFPDSGDQVVLSTVQSASIFKKIMQWKLSLPDNKKVGMIIIDEVHRNFGTKTVEKIIDTYFPDARIVGATGSPFKQNKTIQHLFDKVSYSIPLQSLIEDGTLVAPVLHGIEIADPKDDEEIISTALSIAINKHPNEQVVIYMRTIEQAEELKRVAELSDVTCEAITSKLNGEKRDVILKAFSDRTPLAPRILVTVDVLTAAFDAVHLSVIIMPFKVSSVATYLQRCGRAMRSCEGKDHCDIYMFGDNPALEQARWEKMQRKMLNVGIRQENAELDLECNEAIMSESVKITTLKQIKMSKAVKKKGMEELSEQIMNRQFPDQFLDHLVPYNKYHKNTKRTAKQDAMLRKNGVNPDKYNRNQATSVIEAIAKKQGWSQVGRIVPSGKYQGRPEKEVPFAYRALVSKAGKYYNSQLAGFFQGK